MNLSSPGHDENVSDVLGTFRPHHEDTKTRGEESLRPDMSLCPRALVVCDDAPPRRRTPGPVFFDYTEMVTTTGSPKGPRRILLSKYCAR